MGDKEENHYKELVEDLNDAIYTVSATTLFFTSMNRAAEKLTGYKKSELLTMSVTKVVAPEFLHLVKKMINRKRRKEQSTIYEVELVKKDGSRVPVEVSSRAIYKDGVPIEILGVARDISERKMLDQQRNIFISLITHEIKNPLTSIVMYLKLLQKRLGQDTTALSYISTISEQLNSINRVMDDFLDITQMRVGKFQITKEAFDFNKAIDEVVKTFQTSRHIKMEGKVSRKITADKNRICQVLVNLLSNAVKYSPEDKDIIISVSETKEKITIGVQDFGLGISKTDQKHIFNLFFRIKDAAKSQVKGHGLGLYICHEIIKQHKGKLWVESIPQKGSTFFFTLPR